MPKGKGGKGKSLHINSMSSVKGLMPMLKNGCVTIVVILADWCGACQRVKPMWLQTLTKQNKNNVALIRDDMVQNTMLNDKLKITHFPSVFQIPPGGEPTLLENVSDAESIKNVVNNGANAMEANANAMEENANAMEANANANGTNANANVNEENWNQYESKVNANRMKNSMNVKKGFTPTLEKLKGGRRRRTRRNTRRSRKQ